MPIPCELKKAIEDLLAYEPELDHWEYPEAEIEHLRMVYDSVKERL